MKKNNQIFGIIGVGRFGLAVAEELLQRDKSVIAIDKDPARLKPLQDTSAELFIVEQMSKEALEETGIQDADVIVIGIGKDIESSILAALNAKEFGIERVICKALSRDHAKILEKIGAEYIFPETDIGKRLAIRLSSRVTLDVLPLSDEFSIVQIKVPEYYDGMTVLETNFRKKFNVNIIAVISDGRASGVVGPDTVLKKDDFIVVCGSNESLEKLQEEFERRV
ncbi:MAG TPA: TrkA family potassium uptake protein [Candidatus Ornithospirochaeta avicola]|uniref:TrkA family potassium uptake protein n=1 Tax=Candidatus Ornithospirochaeta avicola TaxID=2840896 RepID=A0A9D1PTF1_9SPIO|nr:TrkA family potassium uptake protein [Candidatus Ornithospirochaeta avicola]